MERVKKLSSQLGHKIHDIGAHMPSAAVGIIRKRRSQRAGLKENLKAGSKVKPIVSDNPYPMDFLPGSM